MLRLNPASSRTIENLRISGLFSWGWVLVCGWYFLVFGWFFVTLVWYFLVFRLYLSGKMSDRGSSFSRTATRDSFVSEMEKQPRQRHSNFRTWTNNILFDVLVGILFGQLEDVIWKTTQWCSGSDFFKAIRGCYLQCSDVAGQLDLGVDQVDYWRCWHQRHVWWWKLEKKIVALLEVLMFFL